MLDIGILVQHPSMEPDRITAELGVQPTSMSRSNDPVLTPKGRETGDRYKWTSWSYFEEDDSLSPNERIGLHLKIIEDAADFLGSISRGGGRVTLIVRHDGDGYAHCEVAPEALALLGRLSVAVGFEVFAE